MKIWTNNGTDDVILCDHGRGGPSNFVPQVVRPKAVLQFVQADFAKPVARGNVQRIWTFSAKVEHATETAAQLYLMTLHQAVPAQVDVLVELDDRSTRFTLPDCVVEFLPSAPKGVLTTVGWTLTFGGMSPAVGATLLADVVGIELNDSEGNPLTLDDAILETSNDEAHDDNCPAGGGCRAGREHEPELYVRRDQRGAGGGAGEHQHARAAG